MKNIFLKIIATALLLSYNNMYLKAQVSSKLMFLTFKIHKINNSQDYNIKLLDKIIVNGKVKKDTESSNTSDKIVFSILDSKDKIFKLIEIDNPLNSFKESFEPDGRIQRHLTIIDSTEFTIRFQYQDSMKKLTIHQQTNGIKLQNILNFSMDL